MVEPIRIDEVLAELARLNADQPDGFTSRELSEAMGVSLRIAGEKLRTWVRQGRVGYAGLRASSNITGRAGTTPVYKLAKDLGAK